MGTDIVVLGFIDEEMEAQVNSITYLSQVGLLGKQTLDYWAACFLGHALEQGWFSMVLRVPLRSTRMKEEGMGTRVNRRSWALMQPTAGLSQTTESSGARVALQSYLRLSWDEQIFIFPLNQSWDLGALRRVDFGQNGSAVGAELQGADGCWQPADHTSSSWASKPFTDPGTELYITVCRMLRRSHSSWVVGAGLEQSLSGSRSFQSNIFLQHFPQRFKLNVECLALNGSFLFPCALSENQYPPPSWWAPGVHLWFLPKEGWPCAHLRNNSGVDILSP